jgi:hypothetical protein
MSLGGFEPAIPAIKRLLEGLHLRPLGHRDWPRHGLPALNDETTLVLRIVHPPHDGPSYENNRCACVVRCGLREGI